MSNCCANSASVLSPRTAARATFALKAGVWFRRGRLVIVSPGLQPFWLLSGRNSTYPDVQISWASSSGSLKYAGLVTTQAIRRGASRVVLDRIAETGTIYNAWADEPWSVEGAA